MAAVSYVEPEDAPSEVRAIYGVIALRTGFVQNLYKALAHEPSLLQGLLDLDAAIGRSSLDPELRELARLAACEANRCEYDQAYAHGRARRAGLSERQVQDLDQPESSDAYDADQQLVIRFSVQASRGVSLGAGLAEELRRRFTEPELVELAASVALACLTNRVCLGLRIELP
jgi:AhpD family alkylhydroperoxidase